MGRSTFLSSRVVTVGVPAAIAIGSLALLLMLGAGVVDLVAVLDAIPPVVRWVGTPVVAALAMWRTVVHAGRLARATGDDTGVEQVRHLALALRAALLGGSLVALLSGWVTDSDLLVGLALVVGLEELYETTMVLGLLELARRGERGELDVPVWHVPEAGRG
jgi:hypothetical protein